VVQKFISHPRFQVIHMPRLIGLWVVCDCNQCVFLICTFETALIHRMLRTRNISFARLQNSPGWKWCHSIFSDILQKFCCTTTSHTDCYITTTRSFMKTVSFLVYNSKFVFKTWFFAPTKNTYFATIQTKFRLCTRKFLLDSKITRKCFSSLLRLKIGIVL
jgi:hypothetical protein